MNKTLQACVKNLEELFDLFNSYLYNGELERPVISIQADKTGKAYGWCTTYKAWFDRRKDKLWLVKNRA